MGIPIGWNIKREDAKEKDVLRADIAGSRSPIRRRVRPNRSPRPHSTLDTDFLISGPHVEWIPRSSHRARLAPPPVPEVSRAEYRSNEPSRHPPTLQRDESSVHSSRNRHDGYMRAYETRATSDHERPLPAFTPGFAPAAASRTSEIEAHRDAQDAFARMREYTTYRRRRPTRSQSPRADRSSMRGNSADAPEESHEAGENNAVAFPPLRRMGRRTIADGPLPASSLRESWSPLPVMDGLGDRNRSVSPFDDQLQWDSFLTTVVDDPVAPSAGSSFASAAAAASFTNSHPSSRAGSANSAASSQTHLTVPSRRPSPPQNEQFMRACDTSEDDSASDTEEEEMDVRGSIRRRTGTEALRNRLNISHSTAPRRRMRPSYFSNEPPARDTERYSLRVIDRSRDASEVVRSFYNSGIWRDADTEAPQRPRIPQLDGPADGPADEPVSASDNESVPPLVPVEPSQPPPLDQELRDARSLLERLARREDVSDDFWASVGLTRSFADPVERFQELERL
jgi:hypothetical protein